MRTVLIVLYIATLDLAVIFFFSWLSAMHLATLPVLLSLMIPIVLALAYLTMRIVEIGNRRNS